MMVTFVHCPAVMVRGNHIQVGLCVLVESLQLCGIRNSLGNLDTNRCHVIATLF